jgi:hypothetical protein
MRRIFKRKQSTKKRGNRTHRHVRSAAIFRRRRTMRGGATDAEARAEGLKYLNGMRSLPNLNEAQKILIVNEALTDIHTALNAPPSSLQRIQQITLAINNAYKRLDPSILEGAAGGTSGAAKAGTPSWRNTSRGSVAASIMMGGPPPPPPPPPQKPFAKERVDAATGGSSGYKPPPPINQKIRGAIIIVRDTSTGNILLGKESAYAVEKDGERKRYISNHSGKGDTLADREYLSGELYKNIASEFSAAAGGGGGGGGDLLVPLVEQSKNEKNMYGPKYGSHPRIRKQGSTKYGAPKGGSKTHNGKLDGNIVENHLDTAQREFIEEVGHVFPDDRYQYRGIVNGYALYLIDVGAAETKLIEQKIAARYTSHIGETFDLGFRDPRDPSISLNDMTKDALRLI